MEEFPAEFPLFVAHVGSLTLVDGSGKFWAFFPTNTASLVPGVRPVRIPAIWPSRTMRRLGHSACFATYLRRRLLRIPTLC